MADKKPPKNVQKLAANAAQQSKAAKAAKAKKQPTVAKDMRLRKQKKQSAPVHVLTLIAQAMGRKKGK
jgi:hypothetical protein